MFKQLPFCPGVAGAFFFGASSSELLSSDDDDLVATFFRPIVCNAFFTVSSSESLSLSESELESFFATGLAACLATGVVFVTGFFSSSLSESSLELELSFLALATGCEFGTKKKSIV